jgi:adenosylmethionine-8-amino-7-oxononanoate aminotransferase
MVLDTPSETSRGARGVWLRPFRDLVYTMPPYVIDEQDLETVSAAVVDAARAGIS